MPTGDIGPFLRAGTFALCAALLSSGCGHPEDSLVHDEAGRCLRWVLVKPAGAGRHPDVSVGFDDRPSGDADHHGRKRGSGPDAGRFGVELSTGERNDAFAFVSDRKDEQGNRYIKLQQKHAGLPVLGRQVVMQFGTDGTLEGVFGRLAPELVVSEAAGLSAESAIAIALSSRGTGRAVTTPVLSVFIDAGGAARLAYEARVDYQSPKVASSIA